VVRSVQYRAARGLFCKLEFQQQRGDKHGCRARVPCLYMYRSRGGRRMSDRADGWAMTEQLRYGRNRNRHAGRCSTLFELRLNRARASCLGLDGTSARISGPSHGETLHFRSLPRIRHDCSPAKVQSDTAATLRHAARPSRPPSSMSTPATYLPSLRPSHLMQSLSARLAPEYTHPPYLPHQHFTFLLQSRLQLLHQVLRLLLALQALDHSLHEHILLHA